MSFNPAEQITHYEDLIDSREVIARIEYLADDDYERDEDEDAELAALRALADEAAGYAADWQYGETLIRDSYFKQYAEQLAEELDLIPQDAKWPATCIDWDQAARELQMDYTSVSFDGIDYWIR
jgi:hypothetical protein